MAAWFWYAVVAAVLYGAHQIFTRLASERIGDGLGGFVVEASAATFILLYLAFLWLAGRWNQKFRGAAIMAIAGILFFHETASWQRIVGVVFAIIGLFLLRR